MKLINMNKLIFEGKEYITREWAMDIFKLTYNQLRYIERTQHLKQIVIKGFSNTVFYEYQELLKIIKQKY